MSMVEGHVAANCWDLKATKNFQENQDYRQGKGRGRTWTSSNRYGNSNNWNNNNWNNNNGNNNNGNNNNGNNNNWNGNNGNNTYGNNSNGNSNNWNGNNGNNNNWNGNYGNNSNGNNNNWNGQASCNNNQRGQQGNSNQHFGQFQQGFHHNMQNDFMAPNQSVYNPFATPTQFALPNPAINANNNRSQNQIQAAPAQPQNNNSNNNNPRVGKADTDQDTGKSLYIKISVGNKKLLALLDTGAQVNLIRKSFVDNHQIDSESIRQINGLFGSSETYGIINMPFEVNGYGLKETFHVVDDVCIQGFDMFLGASFVTDNGFTMNCKELMLTHEKVQTEIFVREVIFTDPINKSNKPFLTRIVRCNETNERKDIDYEEEENFNTEEEVNLLGNPEILETQGIPEEEKRGDFRLDHLEPTVAIAVKDILNKYEPVFEELTRDNFPNIFFDSLKLKEEGMVNTKIYRSPPTHDKLLKDEIERLLELGIIVPSQSSYNSPVWVVPKKSGPDGERKFRVVIDYRGINAITVIDHFPLPNITDIVDQLGGATIFSVIDLTSGYHQISLREEDQHKTGFSALGYKFQFTKLPFGLVNSAAAFQRIMTNILAGLVGKGCFVYIDDIIIYGRTQEEHNENLSKVLNRLLSYKMKIQPSKCHFYKKEISYLGFVISDEGVKMDPEKIKAIMSLNPPRNAKQLKSFLGMAGFYRRFVKDFSKMAHALHNLLKKDTKFIWDDSCQEAFDNLKEMIASDIMLQYPDFSKEFQLTTDASNYGIGAVLSQKDSEGLDRPISFISKALNSAEKNYSVTEKECLAIVWAVISFRYYLLGNKFTILSDHRPLTWLGNAVDPGARLLRWRLKLNDYDYQIKYTPGKTNYVADELSRNMGNEEKVVEVEKIRPSVFRLDVEGEEPEVELEDDIEECLDREPIKNRKIVTDEEEINRIISEQHSGPIGGHRGISATQKAISTYFNIQNLGQKVTEFVKKCQQCQFNKYDRVNRNLPLVITSTCDEPNEKVAFDVIGPFKYPDGRKEYGLTIQDDFSKYILFCGIRDCTAETIAKVFTQKWILNFGIPKILLSDNGSNLVGEIMTTIANFFGIKQITTSVGHPRSNGSVERAHARLAEFIRTTEDEIRNEAGWEMKLALASYCYNSTVHATTGFTPYQMMFGRKPRLISGIGETFILKTPSNYIQELTSNFAEVWGKAKENIMRKKLQAKERDEKKVIKRKTEEFAVGCEVLVMTETLVGKSNRTVPIWKGPFVVTEVNDYTLEIQKRKRITTVNKANCKIFIPDGLE